MLQHSFSGLLKSSSWLQQPELRYLLTTIGVRGPIRCVGGCVRNSILGVEVTDIDLATPLLPQHVTAILENNGIQVIPTGIEHGTVTAIVNHVPFEITTLRRDVDCDGRHAVVEFTDNWERDAQRRDFTMNALYCDLDGNIWDYVGGIDDIQHRRLRFIGDPVQRIHEDALRIFRFFRFQACYGSWPMDQQGLEACIEHRDLLSHLSMERIQHEWVKLLCAPAALKILDIMHDHQMMKSLVPFPLSPYLFGRARIWVDVHGPDAFPVDIEQWNDMRVALLFFASWGGREPAEMVAKKFKLPQRWMRYMRLVQIFFGVNSTSDQNAAFHIRWSALNHGLEHGVFALAVAEIWGILRPHDPDFIELVDFLRQDLPELPVRASDVMDMGVRPGPLLGERLNQVQKWWIERKCQPTREDCLYYLSHL